MIVLSVDPGLSGAYAVLDEDRVYAIGDIPILTDRRKRVINGSAFSSIVEDALAIAAASGFRLQAALESVASRPKQGVSSIWSFARSVGTIEGVFAALKVRSIYVTPVVWKRHAGLIGAEKDASRSAAIRVYPETAGDLRRKRDSGRGDAILIGRWALTFGRGEAPT